MARTTLLRALALGLASLAACGGDTRTPAPDPAEELTTADFRPDLERESLDDATLDERVVSEGELPEAHREVLEAWRTGGLVWEIQRGEVLSDPGLTAFLVDNLLVVVIQEHNAIRRMVAGGGGGGEELAARRAAFARARGELPLIGAPAAEALAEALALGDDVLFTLVRDILEDMGADGAPAVAGLLDRDSALVRYRAALVLGRLPGAGEAEPAVGAALETAATGDDSEFVRVQATRSLGERALWSMTGRDLTTVDLTPARRSLEACLDDSARAVRLEALAGLDLVGDARAVEALVTYGRTATREQRYEELSRAGRTVAALTGEDLGTDVAAWSRWWGEHRDGLQEDRP